MSAPKHIQVLIPRLCEYVTFAYVIQLSILRWKCYPGLPGGPIIIRRFFIGGKQHNESQKTDVIMEAESQSLRGALKSTLAGPEDGRRGLEPRNAGSHQSWKRQGNGFSPRAVEGARPCRHLDFSVEKPFHILE